MHYGRKFEEALIYAALVHAGQKRKGTGVPYITHLLAVAAIVGENGGTEDEAVAALLHDAPEDQGGEERLADIRARFGEEVAEIVGGCSDTFESPKPPWPGRKKAYIRHIRQAPASVRLVSVADKLHNARSVLSDYRESGENLWERFNGGREGTLWYYGALVEAFRETDTIPTVVDDLDRTVNELRRLAEAGSGR